MNLFLLGLIALLVALYFLIRSEIVRERRLAQRRLVNEIFIFNEKDYCFDPIGSVDKLGMKRIVEVIARGRLAPEQAVITNDVFKDKLADE